MMRAGSLARLNRGECAKLLPASWPHPRVSRRRVPDCDRLALIDSFKRDPGILIQKVNERSRIVRIEHTREEPRAKDLILDEDLWPQVVAIEFRRDVLQRATLNPQAALPPSRCPSHIRLFPPQHLAIRCDIRLLTGDDSRGR